MPAPSAPIDVVREARKASVLLKPLRREILARAGIPASAATIAAALGRPRQVVNYHVRQLARAGFLRKAGRQRKRGLTEQRYVVSARAFILAPEMLGAVGPAAGDKSSAAYLLMLATRLQREVSEAWCDAEAQRISLPLLAIDTEFTFATPSQRAGFAAALERAITNVVAEHTSAAAAGDSAYRLVIGCYPRCQKPIGREVTR